MNIQIWSRVILIVAYGMCSYHFPPLRADTIVIPNVYDGAPAIGPGTSEPFNRLDRRMQQIYLSSQFTQVASDEIRIEELRFRVDEQHPIGTAFSTVARGLSIFMSTTTRTFDTASRTFSENYDGVLFEALPASDLPINGVRSSATSFDVVIPLPRAYSYDRRVGNLLVDIQIIDGANLPFLDQQIMIEGATFVVSGAASAQTGTKSMAGLITEFQYTVVPEPSVGMLAILGGFLVIVRTFIKRRQRDESA